MPCLQTHAPIWIRTHDLLIRFNTHDQMQYCTPTSFSRLFYFNYSLWMIFYSLIQRTRV